MSRYLDVWYFDHVMNFDHREQRCCSFFLEFKDA